MLSINMYILVYDYNDVSYVYVHILVYMTLYNANATGVGGMRCFYESRTCTFMLQDGFRGCLLVSLMLRFPKYSFSQVNLAFITFYLDVDSLLGSQHLINTSSNYIYFVKSKYHFKCRISRSEQ